MDWFHAKPRRLISGVVETNVRAHTDRSRMRCRRRAQRTALTRSFNALTFTAAIRTATIRVDAEQNLQQPQVLVGHGRAG